MNVMDTTKNLEELDIHEYRIQRKSKIAVYNKSSIKLQAELLCLSDGTVDN